MLTPRDILQAQFQHKLRGYNTTQVDAFLRRVFSEYETLAAENAELKKDVLPASQLSRPEAVAAPEGLAAIEVAASAEVNDASVAAAADLAAIEQDIARQKARLAGLYGEEVAMRQRITEFIEAYKGIIAKGRAETLELNAALYSWEQAAASIEKAK